MDQAQTTSGMTRRQQAEISRRRIERAAFKLFYGIGYRDSSYTMIAQECGLGRPLVQHHFPRKEDLAAAFLTRALELVFQSMVPQQSAKLHPLLRLTHIEQVICALLLADANMRRFTLEAFSSRNITKRFVLANADHSARIVGRDGQDTSEFVNACVKAYGGVNELMFRALDEGIELDSTDLALQSVSALAALALGRDYQNTTAFLARNALAAEDLMGIVPAFLEALLRG